MHPNLKKFSTVLPLLFLLCNNPAHAISKCLKNGSVTYTDLPCPADAVEVPFTGQASPPDDPVAARQRHNETQKKLQQIARENDLLEQQQRSDAQAAARYARQIKEKERRCKRLDTRRKLAELNQSKNKPGMSKFKAEQARLLAAQAQENYAAQCSAE